MRHFAKGRQFLAICTLAYVLISLWLGSTRAIAQVDSTYSTLPSEPGMYVQAGSDFKKVIGQIAQFTRTGSRLVSTATVGIKSAKANIQLAGPHAQIVVSPQPVFYFIPPKQEAAAGVNAGDFILIRLEEKPHRRQFEIAAAGLFRASAGISLTHQLQILRSEPKPGVYMITSATELKKGEYALYLARGEGMAAYVYDFGVEQAGSNLSLKPSSARPVADRTAQSSADDTGNSNDSADLSATAATGKAQADPISASVPAKGVSITTGGGVLGISAADWNRPGAQGVEIIDMADSSSAQLAGLHKGDVITAINGTTVRSTRQFRSILAQMGPGTRIRISYLYRNDLVWMPRQTIAILTKGD